MCWCACENSPQSNSGKWETRANKTRATTNNSPSLSPSSLLRLLSPSPCLLHSPLFSPPLLSLPRTMLAMLAVVATALAVLLPFSEAAADAEATAALFRDERGNVHLQSGNNGTGVFVNGRDILALIAQQQSELNALKTSHAQLQSEVAVHQRTIARLLREACNATAGPSSRTVRIFSNPLSPSLRQWGTVVATKTGLVVVIPAFSQEIAVFDAHSRNSPITFQLNGDAPDRIQWHGGVLGPNGLVFGIPAKPEAVLVVDPVNFHSVEIPFDSPTSDLPLAYLAGVLSPMNNLIYGIPFHATTLLIIDPVTLTVDATSVVLSDVEPTMRWRGGDVAPDGRIFCAPDGTTHVLIIDPATNSVDATSFSFGNEAGLSDDSDVPKSWVDVVTSSDGLMYFVPQHTATPVVVVHPGTSSVVSTIALDPVGVSFTNAVLTAHGLIVALGRSTDNSGRSSSLVIDPTTRTAALRDQPVLSFGATALSGEAVVVGVSDRSMLVVDFGC